jgi:dihydropyrimidinase
VTRGATSTRQDYDLIIKNGTVVTGERTVPADVAIRSGQIIRVGRRIAGRPGTELDAAGCYVVPGGVDVHTHFGNKTPLDDRETADDWESGTRAAAAGGVTTVVNYVFQPPGRSLRDTVTTELERANEQSIIDYSVHPVITDVRDGASLTEIETLAGEGFTSVKVFTGPAEVALADAELIAVLSSAASTGTLVAVHPEDTGLSSFLRQRADARMPVDGSADRAIRAWRASYPAAVEALAVERVAGYAREIGAGIYLVHISSAEALQAVVEARRRGGHVFCETRPAYLFLDDSRYETTTGDAALAVCLPPLRGKQEQPALWNGLRSGHIQTVGSDHTARMAAEKLDAARGRRPVPAGFGGVQTSFPLLFGAGVLAGRLSIRDFARVSAVNPSKLFGLWPRKGRIAPGSDADLVVLDPRRPVTIDESMLESRSDFDVYAGLSAPGWPVATISRGEVIWHDGTVAATPGQGRHVRRSRLDFRSLALGRW